MPTRDETAATRALRAARDFLDDVSDSLGEQFLTELDQVLEGWPSSR